MANNDTRSLIAVKLVERVGEPVATPIQYTQHEEEDIGSEKLEAPPNYRRVARIPSISQHRQQYLTTTSTRATD